MLDFRKFIAEAYDAEDKSTVIRDFAKYLETALDTSYDSDSGKHVSSTLWFAVGSGNGKYNDDRITVGTNNQFLAKEEDWKTLNFLVSDMGELVAYLDAEDHDLLYNTQAYSKDEKGEKTLAKWAVGVTDEAEKAAFEKAVEFIDEFFKDETISSTVASETEAGYDPLDKFRLMKMRKSRENDQSIAITWSQEDEQQLNDLRTQRLQAKRNLEYYVNAKAAAESAGEEGTAQDCQFKIEDLTKRIKDLNVDINDLEADKTKWMKFTATHKTEREKEEGRTMLVNALASVSDIPREQLQAMTYDKLKELQGKYFRKNGMVRKQRAVKTGDVADAERKEADVEKANIKAQFKANREKAKAALDQLFA